MCRYNVVVTLGKGRYRLGLVHTTADSDTGDVDGAVVAGIAASIDVGEDGTGDF